MTDLGKMHAFLVTADSSLMAVFTNVLIELGIESSASMEADEIADQLNRVKYEGVLVDFDTVSNARPVLANVRESRSNKNAVIFAVATDSKHMQQAFQDRAHFLLRRPMETSEIRKTLRAAYDLMSGEHRRRFRLAVKLPVRLTVTSSGANLDCSTMNVSSNGMAVATPLILKPAEIVDILLQLPDGVAVCAIGIVIWDDKHGKSGLHFQCKTPEMRHKLDSWLSSQFLGCVQRPTT